MPEVTFFCTCAHELLRPFYIFPRAVSCSNWKREHVLLIFSTCLLKWINSGSQNLQGWPRTDVDPLTALLTLFAYEKRTGKILTDKQIQDGDLRDLLQPEDFENAEKVLAFLSFPGVLIYPGFVTV